MIERIEGGFFYVDVVLI